MKGKTEAAREIREAIEGKATVRVEHSGPDGGPVKLSLEATLERIRELYGLGATAESENSPQPLSLLEAVDRGQEPPEDSHES